MGKAKGNPRRSNGHRRNKIRQRLKAIGAPCSWCGKPINYDLPAGHEMAFEVDEIVPVWKGGDPLDFDNCQALHRRCNREKYQQERAEAERRRNEAPKPVKASRRW